MEVDGLVGPHQVEEEGSQFHLHRVGEGPRGLLPPECLPDLVLLTQYQCPLLSSPPSDLETEFGGVPGLSGQVDAGHPGHPGHDDGH